VCIELRLWTTEWLPVQIPPPPPYPDADQYVLWNPVTMASAAVPPPADGGEIMGAYSHPSTRRFHLVHASGKTGGDRLIAPTTFRILRVGDDVSREIPLKEDESKISMAGDTTPAASSFTATCTGLFARNQICGCSRSTRQGRISA
jgi:hypothetical protein